MTAQAPIKLPGVTLEAIRIEAERKDLHRFIRDAWHVVEPGIEFVDGWHIEAICAKLEAVTRGELTKLIINVPPRHMKSLSVSVFWPAWVWASFPEMAWVFGSYAEKLSLEHSRKCRRLVESDWYQERWPHVKIETDQNAKGLYATTQGGARFSTSVGGTVTGMGGNVLVYDDPHKVQETESDDVRDNVLDWHDGTMATRKNSARAAEVLIMQRLHERDLAGYLMEEKEGWEILCLPAEYDAGHPYAWPDDPRTNDGEILWPDVWDRQSLKAFKEDLGSYGYAGQYQQLPVPAEGGILQRDWWNRYPAGQWPQISNVCQSWDMAFKDTNSSDYVVGQVWGTDQANKYLLAQVRGRMGFSTTCEAVKALTAWTDAHGFGAHRIYVEDKANGSAVIDALKRQVTGLIPVEPEGGKEARAHAAAPMVEAGNVWIPEGTIPCPVDPTANGSGPRWSPTKGDDLIAEAASFPRGAHDDQVDATTQALNKLGKGGSARIPRSGGYAKTRR